MAKTQPIQAEPSPRELRLKRIIERLTVPVTPESLVLRLVEQFAALAVQPGREAEMDDLLLRWDRFIAEQQLNLARQAALVRESGDFLREAMSLARPIPTPPPGEQVRAVFGTLQDIYNWASPTIELLPYELQPNERITGCDADGITTTVRRIEREALIIKYRPRAMTPDKYASWERLHTRHEALRATRSGPE